MNNSTNPAIAGLLTQNRGGKIWPILFFTTLVLFATLQVTQQKAFERKQRFIVVDDQAYYVIKEVGFAEAKTMHLDQAELASLSLLNRNPSGFDSERRLKHLFNKPCFEKAVTLAKHDAGAFEEKSLHQKAELLETKIQKMSGRSVQVLVNGQLIRTGIFEREVFNEVLRFQLRMTFVANPSLVENGRFPTVVTDFDLQVDPS